MSKSVMDLSDWQMEGSKGNPVILSGPFGIKRTVNLNWATFSPKMGNKFTLRGPQCSVANLVSEILDLVSPKDFGMT